MAFDNFQTEDEWFLQSKLWKITINNDDRVKSSNIQEFLKRKSIDISISKIYNCLTNRGCIHGTQNFGPKAA